MIKAKKIVKNGIDNIAEYDYLLKGKRLGLVTGPTGLDLYFNSTLDILNKNYNLTAIFSPEHGVRGDVQAGGKVSGYTDPKTGVYVYSLYGEHRKPTPSMLSDVDVLVFDIQDIGVRYYTYMYTLTNIMQCSKPVVVLDRINPLGGVRVEGNMLDMKYSSFVGKYSIPPRYGLTIGEFAAYVNQVYSLGCDLSVVPCSGWDRTMYFDDTNLNFVMPSPNISSVECALCYVGTCLFEGTNMSEGRGTVKPFEVFGAPWLDNTALIGRLKQSNQAGVMFRETYFKPSFSKYSDKLCNGIQLHITDRDVFSPFETTLHILEAIRNMHDEFEFITDGKDYFIDKLLGSGALRQVGFSAKQFINDSKPMTEKFESERQKYFLY